MKNSSLLVVIAIFVAIASTPSRAATWYLQADQSTDWNTVSNWWTQPISGGAQATSISASDDFDLAGHIIHTPNATGTNTFVGAHLILHGGGQGQLYCTTAATNTLVIPNLTSFGGEILNLGGSGNVPISVTNFVNNSNTTMGGAAGHGVALTVTTLSGSGDICAIGKGLGAAGGTVILNITTATAYTGTIYINNGCQCTFNHAMTSGGALDVGGPGTAVTLNATVTFQGFSLNGVPKATGTYTAAALGFAGTGSVIVQAPVISTVPITQAYGANLPGGSFSTPFYPTDPQVYTYMQGKSLNLLRIAFKWEKIQPTLNGPLNSSTLASLDSAVALAASRGMQVVLDMHNYDAYKVSGTGYIVGTPQVPYSAYQYAWQLIAAHFSNSAGIYGYDIMNEPAGAGGTWISTAAQYGVNGVRQSDMTHYVIVEGESHSGAQVWMGSNANLNVIDPANRLVYSAHTYWDFDKSGTYASTSYDGTSAAGNNCYPNMGIDRVAPFVYWLQLKGYKGMIGEFGVPNNVASPDYRWNQMLDNFMDYLNTNKVTATYWSMTQAGWPNTYPLLCATGGTGSGPVDAPAMSVLATYGGGLPASWTDQDIGATVGGSSSTYSSGVYTVHIGGGIELVDGGTIDAFTYVNQPVSGDCTITAHVASLTCGDTVKGEAGVMIRNDLTATSPFVSMGVTTGRGTVLITRTTAGAANVNANGPAGVAPYWVRIVRSGNVFTSYASTDNVTWTQVSTPKTITMNTALNIGLFMCNHAGSGTGLGTFDTVKVTTP